MTSDQNGPSVLVVEDDEPLLRIHARSLTAQGYRVTTALDGETAARLFEDGAFDVVISDIHLPKMDGVDLLKRLREHDPDVRMVLVTGAPSVDTAVRAIELGAHRYLVKPVDLKTLGKIADEAVHLRHLSKLRRQRGLALGSNVDGRYELKRDLGRGAAGLVFEATHTFTGRSVALKVVAPDVPKSRLTELHARLTREARALAAVRHPGVVEVLDGGVLDDGTPYVVMERLDGRTLEGLLTTRGKLSNEETIAVALQLCAALEAVHEAGVVHRDLKPSNLLFVRDRDGIERIKLVDFGIAQVSEPNEAKLTGIGALIGTPAYMAFEQLCALADIDARADVYALGVVMFECLTGEVPYVGNYPRILMQVSSADPPPSLPAGIPAALAAVVARACAKKREDRFASAEDFAAAIRDAFPKASMRTNLLGHIARPDLPPTVAQRRKFPRAPYTTPVHILLPFGTIDGRSEDISEGGMLVICRERCEDKVPVSVRFALPIEGRVVTCVANLRWLRAAQSDNPEGPRALGLEFVNASEALRTSVRRYVDLMGNEERANELLT